MGVLNSIKRLIEMYDIDRKEYDRLVDMIDWPDTYTDHSKPGYIHRVIVKAKYRDMTPEAYLIYSKAKKLLLEK